MVDNNPRFGIFLAPFHSPDENPTLALKRDLDLVVHIDKLSPSRLIRRLREAATCLMLILLPSF